MKKKQKLKNKKIKEKLPLSQNQIEMTDIEKRLRRIKNVTNSYLSDDKTGLHQVNAGATVSSTERNNVSEEERKGEGVIREWQWLFSI